MAVKYQAIRASTVTKIVQDQFDLSKNLCDLKCTINESSIHIPETSFANIIEKVTNNFIPKANLNSLVIYPNDKDISSDYWYNRYCDYQVIKYKKISVLNK